MVISFKKEKSLKAARDVFGRGKNLKFLRQNFERISERESWFNGERERERERERESEKKV